MIFFTADTHFGHENVIRFCNRPFRTVGEMDSILISNWNTKVKNDDTIYIIGDMFFTDGLNAEKYLERLNGKKYLIIGNHDISWKKDVDLSRYFEDVSLMSVVSYNKQNLLTLCHYPMMSWPGDRKDGGYMIHGHLHNRTGAEFFPLIKANPNMLNAGVDINNYAPATLDELIKNNQKFKKYSI